MCTTIVVVIVIILERGRTNTFRGIFIIQNIQQACKVSVKPENSCLILQQVAPNSTSEKVSLRTNLTVLELKFLYYLHVLHTLTKSCFDITDIITTSVFIIIQAVENVGLSCAQCCICLTYVGELFLFVCLFVFQLFSIPRTALQLAWVLPNKTTSYSHQLLRYRM